MTEGRETFLDLPARAAVPRDLAELLASYCAEFSAAYPVVYRIEVDGQPRELDPTVSTELSRIAREALSNAFQHASAGAVEVEVSFETNRLRLRVRDNGKGFDPSLLRVSAGPRHLGLNNMRKRAETIKATFNLWSRPGMGTELEVIVSGEHAFVGRSRAWPFFLLYRKN
jgi:signal transduction histidine kinase